MNLPSIPDNLYKLFVLLGALLIGYFYFYKFEPLQKNKDAQYKHYKQNYDSLISKSASIEDLINTSNKAFDITNKSIDSLLKTYPKQDTLTEVEYNIYISTKKNVDKLMLKLKEYSEDSHNKINILVSISNQVTALNKNYTEEQSIYKDESDIYMIFIIIGIVILLFGFLGLSAHQKIQDELLKRQLTERDVFYDYCQSCGKKFNSITKHSKNSDGTKNYAFCYSCYSNGQFVEPDLTLEELIKRIKKQELLKNSILFRWQIIGRLKSLDRWNKDPY